MERSEGAAAPFAQSQSFGSAGPYVRISIEAQGELDPDELRNAAIEGLTPTAQNADPSLRGVKRRSNPGAAPWPWIASPSARNDGEPCCAAGVGKTEIGGANGRIPYRLEGFILRPADGAKASATLLVETDAGDASSDVATRAVREIALQRGMTVLALSSSPEQSAALRYAALRDLVAFLRRSSAGKIAHVIGRGGAEQGRMLRNFAEPAGNADERGGKVFDGLLLHDASGPSPLPFSSAPFVIETWSSGGYWRSDAERPASKSGVRENAKLRSFFLAGAALASATETPLSPPCVTPVNASSVEPALRALLVALEEWVAKGLAPPASRMPSLEDHSLVAMRDFHWPQLPQLPAPPFGEREVPAIDGDGNETGGLRLPDRAAALGTYTGWNLREGKPTEFCDGHGAFLPFARSKAEREQSGDPRPSLQERYGLRDYYVATVRVVADRLAKERLLLKEDADAYVAAAKKAGF